MEYVLLFEHAVMCYFQFSLNLLIYHNIYHRDPHGKFLQLNVCSVLSVIFGTRNSNMSVRTYDFHRKFLIYISYNENNYSYWKIIDH